MFNHTTATGHPATTEARPTHVITVKAEPLLTVLAVDHSVHGSIIPQLSLEGLLQTFVIPDQ